MTAYSELHCLSHFSWLRGASSPEELVTRAAALGYTALALTDDGSLAGIVRAHRAARAAGIRLLVGSEITLAEGPKCVVLARHREGYEQLVALISASRQQPQGHDRVSVPMVCGLTDCLLLWCPDEATLAAVQPLVAAFGDRFWIAAELHQGPAAVHRQRLVRWAQILKRPVVAAGDVHMHVRGRRALQDIVTAIRLKVPIADAGYALYPNGERHLRSRTALAGLYPPDWLAATETLAAACVFTLDELSYQYPRVTASACQSLTRLRRLTVQGLHARYGPVLPAKIRALVAHELRLIGELAYADYFLTVYDLVAFARARGILCQGRGSAANSVVCYALGITAVDPARMEVLFERFVSRERHEPPDIDIDFEHERREEVIQYLYDHYGRDHAAMTASVITYRVRSAVRDVARALGLTRAAIDRLVAQLGWWEDVEGLDARLVEQGCDITAPPFRQLRALVRELVGRPRHHSQHSGGMVLSATPLTRLIPVTRAAMPGRTVLQWDKDDLDALRILKVDCLGLGMLTALRKALALMATHHLGPTDLAAIPPEDPAVYRMIAAADTIGVFQIESRAQMALLPRLKPRTFYDLVIQVAIVRPGPIQGHMVHPYLRRRLGLEPVTYPDAAIAAVLSRTLGVPLFQEQVIRLAMVAAGFSPGEADHLRRAMAAWHRDGDLAAFRDRFLGGMQSRGYALAYAKDLYQQIRGFGAYGFPESHAASFALLAYASAWLKCYVPDVFLCALLNSQPLGFYAPAQLISDARRHGVRVLPPSATDSTVDSRLIITPHGRQVRLGLGLIRDLAAPSAARLSAVPDRAAMPLSALTAAAALTRRDLVPLARAGALTAIAGARPQALWASLGAIVSPPLLVDWAAAKPWLPRLRLVERVLADTRALGFSLRGHPLAFLRARSPTWVPMAALAAQAPGAAVTVAGLVISRQRPSTANGLVFLLLEDETGIVNALITPAVGARHRGAMLDAALLQVRGRLQRTPEGVQQILVWDLTRLSGITR
ncbi:MAG: error-prone DNA polymerase [Acidiferrobacter sp.]